MTPYELRVHCQGRSDEETRRYRLAIWQAWHTDGFRRSKRLKALRIVLRRFDRKRRRGKPMSPDKVWSAIVAGNKALGGADNRAKAG